MEAVTELLTDLFGSSFVGLICFTHSQEGTRGIVVISAVGSVEIPTRRDLDDVDSTTVESRATGPTSGDFGGRRMASKRKARVGGVHGGGRERHGGLVG